MHFADEVLQHLFCYVEVGDDAISQGTDSDDIGRRAPNHCFGFSSDSQYFIGFCFYGDHRGLVDYKALVPDIDQSVGCAKIDTDIQGKQAKKPVERIIHSEILLLPCRLCVLGFMRTASHYIIAAWHRDKNGRLEIVV